VATGWSAEILPALVRVIGPAEIQYTAGPVSEIARPPDGRSAGILPAARRTVLVRAWAEARRLNDSGRGRPRYAEITNATLICFFLVTDSESPMKSSGDRPAKTSSRTPEDGFFGGNPHKIAVALALTFASGLVDIVGYLGVYHLFTAHVTGTTVQLGRNLARENRPDVISAAAVVAAFFLGSLLGRAVIEVGSRSRTRRIASATLLMEAVMLAATAQIAAAKSGYITKPITSVAPPYGFLAVLAAAMGLQTATLTRVGPLTVHTTFVTGMVNKLAQLVSHLLFRAFDRLRSRTGPGTSRGSGIGDAERAVFLLGIWLVYVGGALAGSLSYELWGIRTLFIAAGLLLVTVIIDQVRPLSVEEEREQSER